MRRRAVIVLMALAVGACNFGGPDEDASGEEIYVQLCSRCHAPDLSGSGGIGPDLGPGSNAATEDDAYIEFTVTNGRGRMPSFSSLDEAQVDRLIGYIREVQGR